MQSARDRDDELESLAALHALQVLDSEPEAEFDALVRVASAVCSVPISLISLIDRERQWFKANIGLPGVSQTPRSAAFCAHAVLGDDLLEIPDATLDPRFADNPLVAGRPNIRFYAGAPLRLSNGRRVGTLCVIDRQPRTLDPMQREVLQQLSVAAARILEGRLAMRQLQEASVLAARAQLVLHHSADAIIGMSATGRIERWNPAAARMFGYRHDEIVGQQMGQLVLPDQRAQQWNAFDRLREGTAQAYEAVRVQRDGTQFDVAVTLVPEFDANQRLLGATKFVRDVSAQKRAAKHVARSEATMRLVLDNVPAMIAYILPDFTIRFANHACDKWFGVAPGAMVGKHLVDFIGSEMFERNQPHLDAALRGEAQTFERVHHGLDGALHDSLSHYLPDIVDGKVVGVLIQAMDITAQKRVEAALRESSAGLREAQRLGRIGSWEWDADADRTIWSEELYNIFGCDPTQPAPTFAAHNRLYDAHSLTRLQQAVGRALELGEPYSLELQFVRPDGQSGWIQAHGEAIRDPDGTVARLHGTVQDITVHVQQQVSLREAHERIALATEAGGIGVWEFSLTGAASHWDARMYALFGLPYSKEPVSLQAWESMLHPDDRASTMAAFREVVAKSGQVTVEFRAIWPDGSVHHLMSTARASRIAAGTTMRMVGVNWDVTPLRRVTSELEEQHDLLRVTLHSIGDAVITTDARSVVQWLNPVAERMTGWLASEAKGKPLAQVFHIVNEETRAVTQSPVEVCLAQGRIVGLANHTILISRDGQEHGIEDSAAPIRDKKGETLGVVLVFHDVSEQRRISGEMTYRATHDALTGLVNRAEFEARLARVLRKAQDEQSEHALLYIDLDQFKLVNDACGHTVGDQLLQQVSKLLGDAIRNRDTLARLGGDEFAIILEHCTVAQAHSVAQKICDQMDHFRFLHEERRFRIGTSIGLVPVDKRWANTSAIQQAADSSCYAAKEAGRNRVHAWFDTDAAMQTRQLEMQWTSRIENALDEDGFVLFAQRIQPLRAASLGLRAEVLLRMKNANGSLALPGAFLPAAERFHLASRVDRWVLKKAFAWMNSLPTLEMIESLSVNLSGQSVGDRGFHAWANELLAEAGAAIRSKLCLEITETAAVTNLADAAIFIEQVRTAGVKVALDDFGAGASSFGYLKALPVDFLKIDGQFIRDLVTVPLDDVAVRCFVDVARVTGVQTVAEFVDQPAVLQRLREIGVDFAQGFLIHQPEPIDGLLELVQGQLASLAQGRRPAQARC